MSSSCMAERMSNYVKLTDSEIDTLEELEKSPEDVTKGTTLFHEGDNIDELYIVKKGWLVSSTILLEGGRQILQLHFPGSMMGSASIAFKKATATLVAADDATLCRFPRKNLGELFKDEARLAALFYSIGMLENVNLCDRLKALGRTNGKARLCNLFLSIFAQIRMIQGDDIDEISMPLSQIDMGDAVGLTPVHINRLLSEMTKEGLIEKNGRKIRLLDEQRIQDISEFDNRFLDIDTRWFPEP